MKPVALVVDDEPQMLSIVVFALETQGFECYCATNAARAWTLIETKKLDLVILDIMLPDTSGVTLCERIRARSSLPVILLTALGEERDRVGGFHAGADDYVTKPFSPRELALRAAAIVGRTSIRIPVENWIENGPLRINAEKPESYWEDEKLVLSDTEWRLLLALARHLGKPVTIATLLNEAWDTDAWQGGKEMVKTAVYRLRRKLGTACADMTLIESAPRGGYALTDLRDKSTPR